MRGATGTSFKTGWVGHFGLRRNNGSKKASGGRWCKNILGCGVCSVGGFLVTWKHWNRRYAVPVKQGRAFYELVAVDDDCAFTNSTDA